MNITAIIILSALLAAMLLTINAQNVFANTAGIEGVPNIQHHSDTNTIPKSFEKKIEHPNKCQTQDGFSPVEKCGGGNKHHDRTVSHTLVQPTQLVQPIVQNTTVASCDNNENTTGQATDFFRGNCEVTVLFESPNSIQLQVQDKAKLLQLLEGQNSNPSDAYLQVQGFELTYHWYEISKTDDGSYTTIVLAPLR